MVKQSIKFVEILKMWEKNRILFNAIWLIAAIVPFFLPELNGNGFINGKLDGEDELIFIALSLLFNFLYTFTWVGTYFLYVIDESFALWFTQNFRYPVAMLPLLILIMNLS